jgi:hypothetical protein
MGVMRPAKTAFGSALQLIAKRLRTDGEGVAHEPLPERWIDLIKYLDAQERRSSERMEAHEGNENSSEPRRYSSEPRGSGSDAGR